MRPVIVDAGIIEQCITEIDRYDRQTRLHDGGCDAARTVLMAKKEAYQNVLKIACPTREYGGSEPLS